MNSLRTLVLAAALPFAAIGLTSSPALASETHYAVVGIYNPTHLTIHYSFRWGDGEWRSYTIDPGAKRWHAWRYDSPNENQSPVPYIMFDADLSDDINYQEYRLEAYASPSQSYWSGKKYKFVTRGGGYALDLVSIN
jgi:hypothetical protein